MRLIGISLAAAAALTFAAACGNNTATDGGATKPDMAMAAAVMPPPLTINTADGGVPADVSCIGHSTDPAAPTEATMVTGTIKDFQDNNTVVGAVVKIYFTPEDVQADRPAATSAPSDMNGMYTIMVPPGHYRVIRANSGGKAISSGNMTPTIPTIEFNIIYSDKAPVSVKTTTKDAIPGLVSVTQMDGLGVLAGAVRDCNDKEVGGALVDVSVQDHPEYMSDKDHIFYFADVPGAGTLPSRMQKWTSPANGTFAALNVPPGIATVTAHGTTMQGGMLEVLSQYKVPVIADAVTIIDMPTGPTTAQ